MRATLYAYNKQVITSKVIQLERDRGGGKNFTQEYFQLENRDKS